MWFKALSCLSFLLVASSIVVESERKWIKRLKKFFLEAKTMIFRKADRKRRDFDAKEQMSIASIDDLHQQNELEREREDRERRE